VSRRAAGSSSRDREEAGAFLERIKQILKDDQAMPRKQRHTAKRIWERLGEDGFTGGYTVVKDAVRELTQKNREVFVPLLHRPGEAQVDFGHALANVNGQLRKVAFFVMALPYGDAVFGRRHGWTQPSSAATLPG
jgi:transposase